MTQEKLPHRKELCLQSERITSSVILLWSLRNLCSQSFVFSDIMSLKEKQVAAKQTFVFLGSLANEYPAKQDVKHKVRIRE